MVTLHQTSEWVRSADPSIAWDQVSGHYISLNEGTSISTENTVKAIKEQLRTPYHVCTRNI